MSRVHARGEDIRRYILDNVEKYPRDISRHAAEKFDITRQAVNKHLQRLIEEKVLSETGKTRSRVYKLCPLATWDRVYETKSDLAEDVIWTNDIRPALGHLPDNVMNIWHYGFTEMFNNAIDHSDGAEIYVLIRKTAADTEMTIMDDGVGIFKKIQMAFGLLDERHSVFELHKGKLTTDPKNHTGEGIFFTSRMFDGFNILSGGVFFSHKFADSEDWILERQKFSGGTFIWMKLLNHTARSTRKIFDQYSTGEDYGFNKTVVPVELAKYGNDQLISRSQAKRLLARVELFKIVIFDFGGVDSIGQAFADEIFRVFANRHPEIELSLMHANSQIKRTIDRAKAPPAVLDSPSKEDGSAS
jgi:anti-sigma regulatory factor (Ser/Thr protein kinase)